MNTLVGDQGHLDRLTAGAKAQLFSQAVENRRKALDAERFPVAPELRRQVLEAPVLAKEAAATLREDFGAGSYGKRLIHAASEEEGWTRTAMIAGGVTTGVFENVAEGVMNPVLWATLGAGHAVTALKGAQAAGAGTAAALTAMKVVHATATVAWWTPWLVSATDNAGKMVQVTSEGKFDKAYFEHAAEFAADALYMFVIP